MNADPHPESTGSDLGAHPPATPSGAPADSPLGELNLTVPAAWIAQLEAIATATRRPLAEVGREAIARYLAITIGEAAEIERLRGELSALKQQLTRLDAIEAILARLSRRQDTLERDRQPSQSPANIPTAAATPGTDASIPEKSDEDWGFFDDEPDEVLHDFLQ